MTASALHRRACSAASAISVEPESCFTASYTSQPIPAVREKIENGLQNTRRPDPRVGDHEYALRGKGMDSFRQLGQGAVAEMNVGGNGVEVKRLFRIASDHGCASAGASLVVALGKPTFNSCSQRCQLIDDAGHQGYAEHAVFRLVLPLNFPWGKYPLYIRSWE